MQAEKLIGIAVNAIRTNFAIRNSPTFDCAMRHTRIVEGRRSQIREWIAVLRIARDPAINERVMQAIPASALMAHDFRRRVLCEGFIVIAERLDAAIAVEAA